MRSMIPWIAAAILAGAPAAQAAKPDYSGVRDRAAALALVKKGELVPILLFPAELGGQDEEMNRVYVPPAAVEARNLAVGTLMRLTREGLVDKMEVVPSYKGKSIVPSAILMKATHGKKGGDFTQRIVVWGE